MARSDKTIARSNRNIQNIAKGINGSMDDLHRSTYMTPLQQRTDLDDLTEKINKSINSIVNRNMDTMGVPSVSKIYSRLMATGDSSDNLAQSLETMFDNGLMTDDLYGMFMSNRYLKELDNEIDTVLRYMPKLEEALDVQRDCVLSADHFSKDFLNLKLVGKIEAARGATFSERIADIKRKYKLPRLVEEIYEDTSKYGEKFIYRVPLNLAIGKLLATKPDAQLIAPGTLRESDFDNLENMNETFIIHLDSKACTITSKDTGIKQISEAVSINESAMSNKKVQDGKLVTEPILQEKETFDIALEICKSGIIESAVRETYRANSKLENINTSSMSSYYREQARAAIQESDHRNIQAKGNIELGKDTNDNRIIANDGLIAGESKKPINVKAPGCVIKKLPRDRVIPIYIDDICLGYYFFELRTMDDSESFMGFKNILGDPLTNMRGDHRTAFNTVDNQRQDQTIKYVAGQMSKMIDKQFVNNNQDLAKEIYMILKYNDLFNTPSIDRIKVTFVPPEDMVHFFFKQDPVTHRGISDLEKSLIPAKIYSSLYITTSLGILTRGQDKRVYYVKQTVDTNIAQTLLNTIAQIKQGNFGIRQFQNINNILNITGRFNDYVIPTNSSGDPPIQFEVMPGQDFNTPTELMNALEEMAINKTGIPIEVVQARQSIDYAMQLTMSSSKVLRFCYKRQELYQDLLAELITPIYNYEYGESVKLSVTLPPPTFINITNTDQLVNNTKNFVNSIVETEPSVQGNDKLKNMYSSELFKHYIGTHLDISSHQDILNRCILKSKAAEEESHSDDAGNDYGY